MEVVMDTEIRGANLNGSEELVCVRQVGILISELLSTVPARWAENPKAAARRL